MAKTENLNLETDFLGLGLQADPLAANFQAIDATIGDVGAVTEIEGDTLAEKLAALEARIAAVEA